MQADAKVVKMLLDNPQLNMVSNDVTYAESSYNEVLTAAAEEARLWVLHVVGKGQGIVYVHQWEDTEVAKKVLGQDGRPVFVYHPGGHCDRAGNLEKWHGTPGAWLIVTHWSLHFSGGLFARAHTHARTHARMHIQPMHTQHS